MTQVLFFLVVCQLIIFEREITNGYKNIRKKWAKNYTKPKSKCKTNEWQNKQNNKIMIKFYFSFFFFEDYEHCCFFGLYLIKLMSFFSLSLSTNLWPHLCLYMYEYNQIVFIVDTYLSFIGFVNLIKSDQMWFDLIRFD